MGDPNAEVFCKDDGTRVYGSHRRKSICTRLGIEFFPFRPCAEDVRLYDIAYALANKCRYTGHTTQFYSVAQHSVLVSLYLEHHYPDRRDLHTWGLLHDGSEGYLPDVPAPIKGDFAVRVNGAVVDFREAEARVLAAIAQHFGLEWPTPPEIKVADGEIFRAEVVFVMPHVLWWDVLPPEFPSLFEVMPELTPPQALAYFRGRAADLGLKE